ncbi:MAG: ATP-binding cassette domain-containing protein [Cyclobacteriaceae bacterium]|nr:ATP-binding cassette domain-containing protein [Cyclobacteriaceae bacterium]
MSEELLKAVIQLFAIVARERITDEEREDVKEFLGLHLNRDAVKYYLDLFDNYCATNELRSSQELELLDAETQQFVGDWAKIMEIAKKVNQALTVQQKLVLIQKIIELVFADFHLSERQTNLIFYIGQALKIPQQSVKALQDFVIGQDIDELASKYVLIVDEGYDEVEYPGPRIIEKNLNGLIAILYLPEAETYFIKYLGISVLYLNSILLRSRKIEVLPAGSTIRGDKVETIYYSDIVGRFRSGKIKSSITFTADHLFYHFKSGRAALQNLNLAEKGGKLIGIMGASGSGKSTLLNVLNGVEKPSSGTVLVNGINIHEHPEKVRGVIGYVPQDDLLIEELSVFENLFFAAKLCFGNKTDEEINQLVDQIVSQLGLHEIKHLKVGSAMDKTISGGQRKRVNIGLELLREPTLLYVDEPTSGLSSRDSENIMDLLKELSLRGKMIFVVIHQPSSDIFKLFDSLLILDVGGFQIYYGNPVSAVLYFREMVNATSRDQGSCPECGNINPEQIFSIIETKVVNEYGRLTNTRKVSPGQWYQYFKQKIKIPKVEHAQDELTVVQKIPNWFNQFKVFVKRDVLAKLANKQYLFVNLLASPILAIFISFMVKYYNILQGDYSTYTFFNNQNIPVYFFMSVVVALFFGLTMSAEEIFRDRKILKRERFLHLSKSSYLVSKITVMFVFSAIQTFLFLLLGNLILEIPLTEMRYWLVLFSISCFANMLGLNISASFNSAVTIYIIIPLLVIPQLLLSGVVINFDKFNPTVGKPVGVPFMGNVMASRWAFEAMMVTQFKDNPFEKQFYELDKTIAISDYKKVYFIPELESKLSFLNNNQFHWKNEKHNEVVSALDLIRTEIKSELNKIGQDKFTYTDKLYVKKFDSATYVATSKFLATLKHYYGLKKENAQEKKDQLVADLTNTPERLAQYQKSMLQYQNQMVMDAVKNLNSPERIVEYKGRLIQKIYPIYDDEHRQSHIFDFSANFYQPTKHFLGKYYDTFSFNLAVIWSMTIILYITLYFDLLSKFVKSFENRRKYKKRRARS